MKSDKKGKASSLNVEYRIVKWGGKTYLFKEIKGLSDNTPFDLFYKRGWIFPDKK